MSAETNGLQVGDLLVFNFPDAVPQYEERIKEDGTITLPLIGSIGAAGKTVEELRNELAKKYPRLPTWHQHEHLFYCVSGEVASPGVKPYSGATTVSRAIQAAGGFTGFANKKTVQLTHADGRIEKVRFGKNTPNPNHDAPVFPGDSIKVKRRGLFAR